MPGLILGNHRGLPLQRQFNAGGACNLRELTNIALNLAKLEGASYADIRIVNQKQESLEVKNGSPEQIKYSESLGFGVRVIVDGAWGFASSSKLEKEEIKRVTQLAVALARASA
ncbi:MAG: hypothetical protein KAT86_06750, partial [Candidatus Latescibacteria bacterium]|nr:hypothetical protein [Candidatus Latescibacterota bacterium]